MEETAQPSLSDRIARLAREHAADRHEQVVELFHELTPALIPEPARLRAIADKALDSAHHLQSLVDLLQIHHVTGICCHQSDEAEAAQQHLERALALAQQLGDVGARARALAILGQVARDAGDLETGRHRLTEALTLYRRTGNAKGEAQALGDLGNLEHVAGQLDVAVRHYGEALPIFTELGDWGSVAMVHHDVRVTLQGHAPGSAVAHGLLGIAARSRAGDEYRLEEAFWELADWLAERQGDIPTDLTLLQEWFDTEQAARAQALLPELQQRMGLAALSSFDPDLWERGSTLIADPAAEQLLRRSADQLVTAGQGVAALGFEAVADTIQRARTVGPRAAAEEERALRLRLLGDPQLAGLTDFLDIDRAMQGDVDVKELDAIRQRSTDPVVQGVLQMFAGRQILDGWQAARNAADVLDAAIVRLEEAATALGPTAGGMWWLEALRDLGSAYRHRLTGDRMKNHECAIEWLGRAFEVPLRPETVMGRMSCQVNLANTMLFRVADDPAANIELAIRLLENALGYAPQLPEILAPLYLNLGLGYASRQTEDPVENEEHALRLYEFALGTVVALRTPDVAGNIHFNLGLLYSRRASGDAADNEDAALSLLTRAVRGFEAAGWQATAAVVRQARATVIARLAKGDPLKNLDSAIAETEEAIAVMESLGRDYDVAGALNDLGNLYVSRADLVEPQQANDALQKARQALQRSMIWRTRRTLPKEWAQTAHNLADVEMRLFAEGEAGGLHAAIDRYRQALTVRTLEALPTDWAQTTRALAVGLLESGSLEDVAEAEGLLLAIVDAGEARVGAGEVRESWAELGNIAAEAEDWPRAAKHYGHALELAEARLAAALLPGTSLREAGAALPLFTAVAHARARCGDALGCALALERSRARALGEAIERDRRDLGRLAEIDAALHDRYVQAATRMRDLARLEAADLRPHSVHDVEAPRSRTRYADVEEARRSLGALEDEIRRLPELSTFLEPFGAGSLARLVETRGPLLYMSVMGGLLAATACWSENGAALQVEAMLGPDGGANPVLGRLLLPGIAPSPHGSRTSFLLAHVQLADWEDVDIDALCSELGQALPANMWEWLAKIGPDRLTIVPCGPLALAPLHAAVIPGTADERLIDRCAVAYAPSARALVGLSPIDGQLTRIAFFGDPNENLCNARLEVEELQGRFPAGTAHVGAAATRAAILEGLRSAEVLHFAGHGRYDPERPLESGLDAADGIVTVAEISEGAAAHGQAARLVTLSACDTAVTDMFSAVDEAIGLPSAFLLAGVNAVIASLWPVDDEGTAELMRYLYDGLANGLHPAAALQYAQRRFRAAGPRQDAQWAPFIYLGG